MNSRTSRCTGYTKITAWLAWFAGIALEAQQRTQAETLFLIGKEKLLTDLQGDVSVRQEKVLVRMLREGAVGFAGGMSAKNYVSITHADDAAAVRELADLEDKGALVKLSAGAQGGKSQRYQINLPLLRAVRIVIDEQGDILEM